MTAEIRFLDSGWSSWEPATDDEWPANDVELVEPLKDQLRSRVFTRGQKSFRVITGISRVGQSEQFADGVEISFWEQDSRIEVPEIRDFLMTQDLRAEAMIREGGSAKLKVGGEVVAEIRHIPTT